MICADLHTHTKYSHGRNTPQEMYTSAKSKGLRILGFSEHSPRPLGFDYTHEYRDSLTRHLQDYVNEVLALKSCSDLLVLFGMEMDWLEGEEAFAKRSARAFDFDYLIGSVHFLGHWGFDDGREPWIKASLEDCEAWYEAYFKAWIEMINSGLYNIAAHPDLIKIYSVERFHTWLDKKSSQVLLEQALRALKQQNMAMEISSAGLRKVCQEIYPAPSIMALAAKLDLDITFASDAHRTEDVAGDFDRLERYAKEFGFRQHVVFSRGTKTVYAFD